MSFVPGTGNDPVFISSAKAIIGAGAGDDWYYLSAAALEEGKTIRISDQEGTNTIQLPAGITIVGSKVAADTLQLTLSNGAQVQVLGAASFTFVLGGGPLSSDGAKTLTYGDFVTEALGSVLPAAGEPTVVNATGVTVGPDGTTTPNEPVDPTAPTYALTGAASVDEGATATFELVTTNVVAGTEVAYTLSGIDADDLASGALTGTVVVGADGKATISVALAADNKTEGAETLTVTAGGKSASTVVNDTSKAMTFTLTAASAEINEGVANTFTVTASEAVAVDTEVTFQLALGTAQLEDFGAGSFNPAKVTIKAGEKTASYAYTAIANDGTELSETYSVSATVGGVAVGTANVTILDGGVGAGETFTLTNGVDSGSAFIGTAGNDTFNAARNATGETWTTGDVVDGGQGNDTINIIMTGAYATPVAAKISNIETINITSGATGSVVDSTTWTGATALNVNAPGAITATAAGTTAVNVTGTAQANNAVAVDGGSTVTVSSTDQTTGTITVGATAAAAGAVTVTAAGNYTNAGGVGADNVTLGAIAVTGGTSVSVTSKAGFTAAEIAAAKTATTNDTVTLSAVTVTGNASTADVTVKQDKSVAVAQAAAAVSESNAVTINATGLTAGQSVTIGGLTYTSTGATSQAQLIAAFENLANGATTGAGTGTGTYSGALTGWSSGANAAGVITFTSSTAGTNVANLVEVDASNAVDALVITPAAAAVEGVNGVTNGAVTINDVNAASATAAGVIKTVTLENYGNSTINSGALTTVNLSGNAGTLGVTAGALNTPAVTTLALNVNGVGKLSSGNNAVTLDADYTTLNLGANTATSTIDNVTATGVKTLNISGDAKVTLSNNTFAALETVTVTNTAGAVLGTTALGVNVTFTGGDGADSVMMTTGHNKALVMGKGDDSVTYAGAVTATKGSVAAGEGNDTIVMSLGDADTVDGNSTFNTTFTGFEILSIQAAGAGATIDLAGINGVSKVTNAGGATGLQTFNNMASGGTFTLTGAVGGGGSYAVGVTNAALATTDSLNIGLTNSTADVVAFGSVTAANVETINISTNDTGTRFSTAATIDTVTLVAAAATKVVVSGNNGLNITNAGNAAITEFDASGVVGNDALDTAANLGVTFVSAHGDATKAVTIKGGAGNDTLTGAANADTITGGEGADTITGGAGNDTIILTETTAARDVVVFNAVATNGVDTIKGFQAGNTTTSDKVMLVAAATTNANLATANVADFGASTNTTLTAGAAAFALTGANTATDDIIEINATLSSYGNLGLTGATSGAELLKALSSTDSAATSITADNVDNDFYLVAYQNGNAYLYQVVNDANTAVIASEITLVGTFEGVAQGAFVAGDFLI